MTRAMTIRSQEQKTEQGEKSSKRRSRRRAKQRGSRVTQLRGLMALLAVVIFFADPVHFHHSAKAPVAHTLGEPASSVEVSTTGKPLVQSAEQLVQPQHQVLHKQVKSHGVGTSILENLNNQFARIDDFYEYEENQGLLPIKVAGRLAEHVSFWQNVYAE